MPTYSVALTEGFVLSAGLIVCIGPQNSLILRQGLRRQHLLLMALLCILLDMLLIGVGAFGLGALAQGETLTRLMTYGGVVALLVCGAYSFRSAFAPTTPTSPAALLPSRKQVVLALLAVTLLNPSAYIDTLLLIGGNANHYHGDLRLWFVTGAVVASSVWFFGLSYGSALLAPLLGRPSVLRGLDLLSGGILWLMAFRLSGYLG